VLGTEAAGTKSCFLLLAEWVDKKKNTSSLTLRESDKDVDCSRYNSWSLVTVGERMGTRAEALRDSIFQSMRCIPLVLNLYTDLTLNHTESYEEKVIIFQS
jgi:hypothetical protein